MVPDDVIRDFASVLGVETDGSMDVDNQVKRKQSGFDAIRNKVKELIREGYSATQILTQVNDVLPFQFEYTNPNVVYSCMTLLSCIPC